MAAPVAMDVRPITTPHLDLDHLPLVDKDFQIKYTDVREFPVKLYYQYKDQHLNKADQIGLWESNLPRYQFPEVHIFPKNFHYCHTNYSPNQRAVMSPNEDVLFTITVESINEMLHLQPGQNLTPISIGNLLDQFPKLTTTRLAEIFQTFIVEEKYIPKDPPPYMWTIFSKLVLDTVSMISSVLGYTTSEYVDEIILTFMSIFTPRQPPAVMYDYAKYISDKMHEQFLRMDDEECLSILQFCTTFSYIIKLINSHLLFKNLLPEATLG